MQYNPDIHHRRSIRLKGYDYASAGLYFITICTHQRQCLLGEIVDGEMRLNHIGQLVQSHWLKLPYHHAHVELDAWVIMPNHIHGILILNPGRGAALGQNSEHLTDDCNPNAAPSDLGQNSEHPTDDSIPNATPLGLGQNSEHLTDDCNPSAAPSNSLNEPGVAFGRGLLSSPADGLPNAAPLPARLGVGTVGAIVLNFKSGTTRSFNRIKGSPESSLWQRNYYEHIVGSEASLCRIRQYIYNNPIVWQQDQLHPGNLSK